MDGLQKAFSLFLIMMAVLSVVMVEYFTRDGLPQAPNEEFPFHFYWPAFPRNPTHCYEITFRGIRIWPPGWHAAVDEGEALIEFNNDETCWSIGGEAKLWQYRLVYDEATEELRDYDPESRFLLDRRTCQEKTGKMSHT